MENQLKDLTLMARDQKSCSIAFVGAFERVGLRISKNSHETADNYLGVITPLDDKHRAIICKDAIQWIIQVKRGQRRGQSQWVGKSHLTTTEALIAASEALCGPLHNVILDKLLALPSKPTVQL